MCLAGIAQASPLPENQQEHSIVSSDLMESIQPMVWYLEDPTKSMAFTEARNFFKHGYFRQVQANFNFGYNPSNHWFVFKTRVSGSPSGSNYRDIIIEFNYPHLDDVVLFRVDPDNTIHILSTQGDRKPFDSRVVDSNLFVTPDRIKLHETYEYWVKIDTTSSTQLHPSIWDRDRYLEQRSHIQITYGFYFGLLIIMAVYNLFIGFSTKDISYFYYFGYITSFCLLQACLWGYSYQYLWPGFPQVNNYAIPSTILLSLIFGCGFTRVFLQTQRYSPKHDHALRLVIIVSCVLLLINFFVTYKLRVTLSVWTSLFGTLALLSAAITLLLKGHRFARLFLLAWSVMLIGAVVYGFTALGFFPANFVTQHSAQIGSGLEVILLSFALADRINRIKAEKRELEKEAKEAVESKNEELRQALEQLTRSNSLKDEFLATISHELRTPMNGIEGSLQIVQQSIHDPKMNAHLDAAFHSAHHMTQLVESLLEYSELQSGNWKLNEQPFNLNSEIKRLTQGIQKDYVTQDVEFRIDNQLDLDHLVVGDADRIHHMLFQLLDNAFKFTTKGSVSLAITSRKNPQEDSYDIKFRVADTGIGISPTQLQEIFEGFRQVDGSFSRQYGGLGIGLSICKAITDRMNGTLTVDSIPNQGTTFGIHITLNQGAKIVEKTTNTNTLPGNPGILVVEDNPVNQMTLVAMMKKLGCRVYKANNGEEAVKLARQENLDCILMDCQMPIMDGFEATQVIRQLKNGNQSIPIIAVTANAMSGDRDRCLAAGMSDYIKKPIKLDEITERLYYWLIDKAA